MMKLFINLKKPISVLLLFIFISEAILPLRVLAQTSSSNPTAEKLSEYIDPFTGDFSYSIPLLNVSGPNGEHYPIHANYSAGIKTNQESSWIGLGWDVNIGEISRSVNGFADDWNGVLSKNIKIKDTKAKEEDFLVYGPLYFKNFNYRNTNSTMDIYQSSRQMTKGVPFQHPDYDDYYVSGMGKMRPYLFEYASLVQKNIDVEETDKQYSNIEYLYNEVRNVSSPHYKSFTKSPEFRFENELSKNQIPIGVNRSNSTNFITPQELDKVDDPNNKYFKSNGVNLDNNELLQAFKGKQVFYYTNAFINENYSNLISTKKFLDYRKVNADEYSNSRPTPNFPMDGIGAFQIIDVDGMTYHYSLPVYSMNEESNSFVFVDESINSSNYNFVNAYKYIDENQEYLKIQKHTKYASSWKLTAITGPDFIDNGDGVANDADQGYWISFEYGKWTAEFNWRAPYYGCYTNNIKNFFLPNITHNAVYKNSNYYNNLYREGSFSTGSYEDYYLNTIETATQKAVFVKDLKADGHSVPLTSDENNVIPKLKLKQILLFNKKDIHTISFKDGNPNSFSNQINNNQFNANEIIDVHDIEMLNANKTLTDAALKTIDFKTDYSLCKGVYNNTNINNVNTEFITHKFSSSLGYTYFNYISDNIDNNFGKLTLVELDILEKKSTQIYPSYKFDYHQNNPAKNPNYNPDQQDFWGYYKSDFHNRFRGHYTTYNSAQHVDAWSLKKITTPIGSEILINYESDNYESVSYDENEQIIKNSNVPVVNANLIQRIFQVNNVSDGHVNDNGKAYFLDNDVFHFYSNINEDRSALLNMVLPLYVGDHNKFEFLCTSTSLPDEVPSFSPHLNNQIGNKPSDGNYMKIAQRANAVCPVLPSSLVNLGSLDYYKSGFYIQYLKSAYGGGTRVKTISIKDPLSNLAYHLHYKYKKGIATSEPDYFASVDNSVKILELTTVGSDGAIPTSMVGYSEVEIQNSGANTELQSSGNPENMGKVVLEFYNYINTEYKANDNVKIVSTDPSDLHSNRTLRAYINIDDYHNLTHGKIKRKTLFDNNNNSVSSAEYLYSQLPTSSEIFYSNYTHGVTNSTTGRRSTKQISSLYQKNNFVTVLTNVVSSANGLITNELRTNAADYNLLTGSSNRILQKDIAGRILETINIPAYTIPGNEKLGPKPQIELHSTNQLSNVGLHEIYSLENGDINTADKVSNKVLLSANRTYWSATKTERKYNVGTGHFYNSFNEISPFYVNRISSYNGNTDENLWDVNAEVYLLDEHNRKLEIKDQSGRSKSSKYNSLENGLLAECTNANYASFTYSSFEDIKPILSNLYDAGGELRVSSPAYVIEQNSNVKAHTGKYITTIPANEAYGANYKTFVNHTNGIEVNRKYVAKVWIHKDSDPTAKIFIHLKGKVNGVTKEEYVECTKTNPHNLQVGDWVLAKVELLIPNNFSTPNASDFINVGLAKNSSGTISYFDDFMFAPIDANVNGFVFDQDTKLLNATIGNDGLAKKFEYDKAGRIVFTYNENVNGLKIISKNKYNFSR
jgi:hypothetical protein